MVYIDEKSCIGCGNCIRRCPMGVFSRGEKSPQIHPGRSCIMCMHCAAGCPEKAIRFEGISADQLYPETPEDPLQRLISTRRSIRSYSEKLPPKELIVRLLNMTGFAPSGKNQRAYHWTVVWGVQQVQALRSQCLRLCEAFDEAPELPKLMAKGVDLLTCGAPCMIVAWGPDDCLNPVLDPAVAMAQLELLLVDAGLSTCWGGYLRQISDRFPEIRTALGLREDCRVRCALMVGYAENETYLRPVWRPEVQATWLEDPV